NGGLFEVASRPSQAATATVNMYVEDILWSTLTILKMCRTRFASVDSSSELIARILRQKQHLARNSRPTSVSICVAKNVQK
ncbi:MAG: hypothetical protein ACXV5H_12635, partial [Halobacteriota archaeon]